MHGLEEILEKVTRRAGDKVGAKLCFKMIGFGSISFYDVFWASFFESPT